MFGRLSKLKVLRLGAILLLLLGLGYVALQSEGLRQTLAQAQLQLQGLRWDQTPSTLPFGLGPILHYRPHTPSKAEQEAVRARHDAIYDEVLSQKIDLPRGSTLVRGPGEGETYVRENATFVVLVRNTELRPLLRTLKELERTFNGQFHYPYVFLNDQAFTDLFIAKVRETLSHPKQEVFFERIEPDVWNQPASIDKQRQEAGTNRMAKENVAYARNLSYRNMCRYNAGGFYRHPRVAQYRYYWRLEPGTRFFCTIDYDVFRFMADNRKVYGFVISVYDIPQSVESLWSTTLAFLEQHPHHLNPNGAYKWLTESTQNPRNYRMAKGYLTCHFWSNFEIGDMDFYRGEAYSQWFDALDAAGGFYYERWGDAPVHSMGLALFADKSDIHWFRDIGYEHPPYLNCPNLDRCKACVPAKFSRHGDQRGQSCLSTWWEEEMSDAQKQAY